VRKLPPATVLIVEPDGTEHQRTYWNVAFERRAEHAGWSAADWAEADPRGAAYRCAAPARVVPADDGRRCLRRDLHPAVLRP